MPRARVVVAVALAAAAAVASVDGFQVVQSPLQPMDPTEPHRMLQQWFTVGQDSLDALFNHETLQTLKISIPGRVFVSYSYDFGPNVPIPGPSQAAIVRVSGNAPQIFDFFEVVATAPHEIEIRRRPNARGRLDEVFMLTEISVTARHQISQIISTGPADLVIEDGVLIDSLQSKLKLQLEGSGNVYIDTRSSALAAGVEVDCSSSGDLYWSVSSLQTPSLKLKMAGSGDLNIVGAGVDMTTMDVALAGSGDMCLEATSFKTDSMKITTFGSGEASISTVSGRCNREEIAVLGSGDATLGGVECNEAKVSIMGSGDVYIQALNSVAGEAWGSGEVKYIGSRPALISDRHDEHAFSTEQKKKYKPIAVPAIMNPAVACRVGSPPGRTAVQVTMSVSYGAGIGFGPLIFFAIISLCYLRSQRKTKRPRAARFGDYTHASELHPLVTASVPPFGSMPPPPPQQQQRQQQQQGQVYV